MVYVVQSYFKTNKAGEMTQYIQVIVAKLSDLSSVPRTHMARTNFCMLSFDLHLHTGMHASPRAYTHIFKYNQKKGTTLERHLFVIRNTFLRPGNSIVTPADTSQLPT